MGPSEIIGAWVVVGLTLCMFSFLYKDNPFFKFGEHLYVGVSVGYGITVLIFQSVIPKWVDPLFKEGQLELLIPTFVGLLLLTQLTPKYSWLSKLAIAFIMGIGAGMAIPRAISSYLLQQTQSTVEPLLTRHMDMASGAWFRTFSFAFIALGVLAVLIYFFFSVEHKGLVRSATRVGIIFLMISFGASFGYTAMARMSLLYGRCYELYNYTSSKYYYATYITLGIIVISVVLFELLKKKKPKQPA